MRVCARAVRPIPTVHRAYGGSLEGFVDVSTTVEGQSMLAARRGSLRGPIVGLPNERSSRRTRAARLSFDRMEGGPGAVLAVTAELRGLGHFADLPVGTRLKYSGGRRNRVKIAQCGNFSDPTILSAEIARGDVWTLAHWPSEANVAESARPSA